MVADGFYKATIEAQHNAYIKTEEDCNDFGIIQQLYVDGKYVYTEDAKRLFDIHYKAELKRLGYDEQGRRIRD